MSGFTSGLTLGKEIASGFRVMLQLDQALKSSVTDVEASFEVMLWKLTR